MAMNWSRICFCSGDSLPDWLLSSMKSTFRGMMIVTSGHPAIRKVLALYDWRKLRHGRLHTLAAVETSFLSFEKSDEAGVREGADLEIGYE